MENKVLTFGEFINEELNLTRYDNGVCRFSDRWFYYNPEDDIIYGCDKRPEEGLFSFNPKECKILLGGEEKQYDINNPVFLIHYNLDTDEVKIYTETVKDYLQKMGFKGTDIISLPGRNQIQDIFEKEEADKYLLVYGDQMIASTFDVIEEN